MNDQLNKRPLDSITYLATNARTITKKLIISYIYIFLFFMNFHDRIKGLLFVAEKEPPHNNTNNESIQS